MLPPFVSERALIDQLSQVRGQRALVISPGRGQAAAELVQRPGTTVTVWYADLHKARMAEESFRAAELPVSVVCSADLPEETFDLVTMATSAKDEAEWTRDVLQQACQRLALSGELIVAVDNPEDNWLRDQIREIFGKASGHVADDATVYVTKKTKELKRIRDFSCEFAFRDEGRLVRAVSRPGVFSHRRMDPGARQLLSTVDLGEQDRVLDLGCGCGVVGLACALRIPSGHVFAVDSHARAIECTQRGAELNQIANLTTLLNADGEFELPEPIDVVLANPPYFGDFVIAEHFLGVAKRVLRPGGAALFVTKFPSWYAEQMPRRWSDVEVVPSGSYHVACGRQP